MHQERHRVLTRVFLYGTLLPGEANHAVLRGARRVGEARTEPAYTLVDLGPYPALVRGGEQSVAGELWEVSGRLLARLDDFEGHPTLYRRETVRLADGGEAQAYVLPAALAAGAVIPSASWRARRR